MSIKPAMCEVCGAGGPFSPAIANVFGHDICQECIADLVAGSDPTPRKPIFQGKTCAVCALPDVVVMFGKDFYCASHWKEHENR